MNIITRWEPFRETRRLHDMIDRFMDSSMLDWPRGRFFEGYLPLDLYQTEDELVVQATIPGMKPEDIDISVSGDTLTISGEAKQEFESEGDKEVQYIVRERRFSSFSRSITLPTSVQSEKASAEFEDGILTLKLPKAEEVKPKRITVKSK